MRPSRLSIARAAAAAVALALLPCAAVAGAPVAAAPAAPATPATSAASAGVALDGAALEKEVTAAALDPARAVEVKELTLNAGTARVDLGSGIVIPAAVVGGGGGVSGRTLEMVFVGSGHVTLEPPDDIEAGQLDLFTAQPRLDETVSAAVLVLGMDSAAAAILRRPKAAPSAAQLAAAQDLFGLWKRRERRVMGIEGRILARAAGDPSLSGYFAALCRGARLGDFLYVFDPQAQEQVTLGRFVPLDATPKESKKILKDLVRQQRSGHMLGMDMDQMGTFDTWVSTARRNAQGQPEEGAAEFEPRLYELDADLGEGDLRLTGRARIELVPVLRGARSVRLRLGRDLQVQRVLLADTSGGGAGGAGAASTGEGAALPFHRSGTDLTVLLPRAYGEGEVASIRVDYSGSVIEKEDGFYEMLSTTDWYPHAGEIDRARYRVTFHWPKRLTLLASGHRVAGGEASDGRHWETRALDQPNLAFSFEIGKFRLMTAQAGHVRVTMGLDDAFASHLPPDVRDEMLKTVVDALAYYESVFGPYPMDELAVATAPRFFSQGTPGLVTLSDLMVMDLGIFAVFYDLPDRRAIIAHEVAHQWWGDSVGWASYRDQWISEALASYCATRFAQARLDHVATGLEAHWRGSLTATIADGRDVESMGPVVLGARLFSSMSSDAYEAIVYEKGAMVLKTLEATLGADVFLKALAQVYRKNLNGTLSTRELVDQLGALTSTDLRPFAAEFIYGTGLPTVLYSYHFAPKPGGGYQVTGTTRRELARQYRYRVVRAAGGALDVQREAIAAQAAAAAPLAVPADIEFVDPARPPAKKGGANATMHGRFWVRGAGSGFSIDAPGEPKGFFLDRQDRVFARFVDEQRHPRLSLLVSAHLAADEGQAKESETLLEKALATDDKNEAEVWANTRVNLMGINDPILVHSEGQNHGLTQRRLTAEIQLSRARLFLEQGRDAEARAALDGAGSAEQFGLAAERDVLLARLDIHAGRFADAFHRLQDSRANTAESTLLLAIASQATGHHEELEAALKAARRRGADATLLEHPATAANVTSAANTPTPRQ